MGAVRLFGLVVAGGTLGTLARFGLGEWVGADRTLPLATLLENVGGSFLLGLLLAWLLARGRGRAETWQHQRARLLLGTGLLGGFTTYSALALETDALLRGDHVALALTYALGTVAAGLLAALAGVAAGRMLAR